MKTKIDTLFDEKLILDAERRAKAKNLTINELLEEALVIYLNMEDKKKEKRSVSRQTKGSMKIPLKMLKAVMEEKSFYEF